MPPTRVHAARKSSPVLNRSVRIRVGRYQTVAGVVAPVNGQVSTATSCCGRSERTKFGSFSSLEYASWKTGVSDAEIGGIIHVHSASTARPFFASACTHLWNLSVAV